MAGNPPTNKDLANQHSLLATLVANLVNVVNNLVAAGGVNPPPMVHQQQQQALHSTHAPGLAAGNSLINLNTYMSNHFWLESGVSSGVWRNWQQGQIQGLG